MKNKDNQKGFLIPEIVKLSERLAKDPTSKLFVPLAEEYFKAGMLEEAVTVLVDGLKVHPGFISAHLLLGRIYLEEGQIKEAKEQFETVIQASPDKVLAHRSLVKIYYNEGAIQQAIQSCRAVLSSNPKDEEMKKILAELEIRQSNAASAQKSQPEVFTANQTEEPEIVHNSVLEEESKQKTAEPEPTAESMDLPESSVGRSSQLFQEEEGIVASPSTSVEDEGNGHVVDLKEEEASLEEILKLMEQQGDAKPAPVPPSSQTAPKMAEVELATESLAELYIKQGFYDKGVEIYQVLFSKDPENKVLLQKLKEAIALSKTVPKAPTESEHGKTEKPTSIEMPNGTETADVAEEIRIEEQFPQRIVSKPSEKERPSKEEKIQKLQAWLERVKRGQNK